MGGGGELHEAAGSSGLRRFALGEDALGSSVSEDATKCGLTSQAEGPAGELYRIKTGPADAFGYLGTVTGAWARARTPGPWPACTLYAARNQHSSGPPRPPAKIDPRGPLRCGSGTQQHSVPFALALLVLGSREAFSRFFESVAAVLRFVPAT
jgi:hypothetical protein